LQGRPSPTKRTRVPAEPRGRVEVLLRIVGDVDTLGSGSVLTLELLESFGMWLPVRAVRPELIGDHHPREPPVQAKRLDLVSLGCGIPVGEESQLDVRMLEEGRERGVRVGCKIDARPVRAIYCDRTRHLGRGRLATMPMQRLGKHGAMDTTLVQ